MCLGDEVVQHDGARGFDDDRHPPRGGVLSEAQLRLDTSLRLMLPAIDLDARTALITGLATTAPPPVVDGVLAIAGSVLSPDEGDRLARIARTCACPSSTPKR